MDRLHAFNALIQKWSSAINLIAPATLPDIWARHILDSAQLLPLAPHRISHWADLGSGAGLPGMVIAILASDSTHPPKITLIESDLRKAAFLKTCQRELSLDVNVIAQRIEMAEPLHADVVSARALAPLSRLLSLVQRHLAPDGTALLPKGQAAQSEIDDARKSWHFDLHTHTSHTNAASTILRLERITRA